METPRLQMDIHKANSWLYCKLGIHTLGLVLRSGISITSPDPKADLYLQTPLHEHQDGTIKVIVVCMLLVSRTWTSPLPGITGLTTDVSRLDYLVRGQSA